MTIDNPLPLCYYSNMQELKKRNDKIAKEYRALIGKGAARKLASKYHLSERRISQIYYKFKINELLKNKNERS